MTVSKTYVMTDGKETDSYWATDTAHGGELPLVFLDDKRDKILINGQYVTAMQLESIVTFMRSGGFSTLYEERDGELFVWDTYKREYVPCN